MSHDEFERIKARAERDKEEALRASGRITYGEAMLLCVCSLPALILALEAFRGGDVRTALIALIVSLALLLWALISAMLVPGKRQRARTQALESVHRRWATVLEHRMVEIIKGEASSATCLLHISHEDGRVWLLEVEPGVYFSYVGEDSSVSRFEITLVRDGDGRAHVLDEWASAEPPIPTILENEAKYGEYYYIREQRAYCVLSDSDLADLCMRDEHGHLMYGEG